MRVRAELEGLGFAVFYFCLCSPCSPELGRVPQHPNFQPAAHLPLISLNSEITAHTFYWEKTSSPNSWSSVEPATHLSLPASKSSDGRAPAGWSPRGRGHCFSPSGGAGCGRPSKCRLGGPRCHSAPQTAPEGLRPLSRETLGHQMGWITQTHDGGSFLDLEFLFHFPRMAPDSTEMGLWVCLAMSHSSV